VINMKIGIISDTHIKSNLDRLDQVRSWLSEVDFLIHVGDFTGLEVVRNLVAFKNLIGVWGNNDGEEIKKILKEKEILEVEGYRIGLFHGHGEKKTTQERALEKFKDDSVDIIVFGHSHQPLILTKNKILLLNPGSPTNKRRERWFSYIVLQLEQGSLKAELRLYS